ncbi:uncharacterized protein LOC125314117 [Rhodamnia argentea]|uniref:Uncharacterized protein LOC125314117 n=1 Tax=Rhodamnia argentea TaxID=178133 RepID=A0ABM3H4L0_9MYRT|nr:uncharacterized protein LOC125314117 [Rhodamnia argentea]
MNNRNARTARGGATQEDPRVDGLLRALEALGDIVGQQVRNQAAAAPPEDPLVGNGNGAQQIQKLVKQFLDLKPPKFSGIGDPEAATHRIKEPEKAFALPRCNEEDKVTLAPIACKGMPSTGGKLHKAEFSPKMAEFMRPRQNPMSVDRYEAKFFELSMYAPRMVEDPVDRTRRFRDGLKPRVKDRLVPLNLKDYNELYERARLIERNMMERAAASGSRFVPSGRNERRFGKRPMLGGRSTIPPNRRNAVGKPALGNGGICRFCNRRHGIAPCPFGNGACFGCGRMGHQVRDCPRRQRGVTAPSQQGGQPRGNTQCNYRSRPPKQGRVFAVSGEEAKDSPTVTGTVFLHDHIAYALFDPGATHSFVAEQLVKLVGLSPKSLETVFKISTPLKDSVISRERLSRL